MCSLVHRIDVLKGNPVKDVSLEVEHTRSNSDPGETDGPEMTHFLSIITVVSDHKQVEL